MSHHLTEIMTNKSSPYALELLKHIKPYVTFEHYPTGTILHHRQGQQTFCHIVNKGLLGLHRQSDNLMISTARGPVLMGFYHFAKEGGKTYLKTLSPCEIGMLELEKAEEIIEQKNLWRPLAKMRGDAIKKLYLSLSYLTADSAYDIISIQLLLLMNEPKSYRLSVPVESYIRQKTHLSRSGTMKILSQLRRGNYIQIENGKLININKLPDKY